MLLPMEITTPVLVVDQARLDRNLRDMAGSAAGRGTRLRPHAKTHKTAQIGRRQLDLGAVGLTVATIGEAEHFAGAGMTDLFIAYPLWPSAARLVRLEALAERIRLRLAVESTEAAAGLARLSRLPRPPEILIEVDSGHHRTGIGPAQVGEVAIGVARAGLPVAGVFTFPGHSYAPGGRAQAAQDEAAALAAASVALRSAGIEAVAARRAGRGGAEDAGQHGDADSPRQNSGAGQHGGADSPRQNSGAGQHGGADRPRQNSGAASAGQHSGAEDAGGRGAGQYSADARACTGAERSGGSTPTAALRAEPPVTELRPGVYVFNDAQQLELGVCGGDQIALAAAATVVSRHESSRFVLDAGSKVLGADRQPWSTGFGRLLNWPEARIVAISEHHATVVLPPGSAAPELGDIVAVVPNHVCTAVNLTDELLIVREGKVVDTWRVMARGANR
jgi:D-serine deaminase-like pyridoxal phosphate-dependent protein